MFVLNIQTERYEQNSLFCVILKVEDKNLIRSLGTDRRLTNTKGHTSRGIFFKGMPVQSKSRRNRFYIQRIIKKR